MSTRSERPAAATRSRRLLGLRRRDRDADRPHPVVARRVHRHAAPTAPDVEQPLARLQVELAADELVLLLLGAVERIARLLEHRARVRHGRAEHHLVELVRDVVVVLDRRGVALLRVPAAAQVGFLRRRRQRLEALDADELHERAPLLRVQLEAGERVTELQGFVDVALDVEVARHVGRGRSPARRAR